MIRNEQEYREASERIEAERNRLDAHRKSLSESGLGDTELARAMEPLVSFHEQLREEVAHYENLKRGVFPDLQNLRGLGVLLVSLRIARGITQRELAAKLDVHESQVSRDERNEYHGVTLDRANRILDALDVRLQTTVVEAPLGRETTDA
ncbi:helix-turn-helix domain-containing protein [Rosistilla oblonga]|uniref:Helix-turn-helix protein n=1 Tax=Rosistilla oblonga TaxID=2527990 RepID=A0A518IZH2_9BACT|nr:helix-turn-helix transcriptional regulator [Rosistilla oblonga]QDV58492.1 helix-turn-helix protein [Rosistilla oblonga]